MFVRMEVIVSVLIYVLVGLDGKANTAEDVSLWSYDTGRIKIFVESCDAIKIFVESCDTVATFIE